MNAVKPDENISKRTRVGIFTYDFFPWEGGMGRHVSEITSHMSEQSDMKILIFSPCRNSVENHFPLFTFTKKIGKNALFSVLLNIHLQRIIKEFRLDVLHLHSGSGGLFLYCRSGKKVIVTTHTNSYLHQFRQLKKISKLLLFPLEKLTYKNADNIISVSSYIKKKLINDYRIRSEKIQIIPNGVHTAIFKENTSVEKRKNTILFAGRIDRNKGLEFLIESLELVQKDHRDVQLLVSGEGKYKNNLRDYLKGKKIASNVHFLGWQNDQNLLKLYNQATLYILPSMSEGFGLTIIEAMACGCPVIASDSGGSGDIIRDGINGFLVKHGDIEQLATLIRKLLTDPVQREQFGRRGKETVKTRFNWDIIAGKYLELYTSLT